MLISKISMLVYYVRKSSRYMVFIEESGMNIFYKGMSVTF